MMLVDFVADIEPCAKGRPRFGRTKSGAPVTFTPEKTRRWESDFAAIAARHRPRSILTEPLALVVSFVLRRPKRLMAKKAPRGRVHCDRRPDLDNLEKAVMDAMSTWWTDDSLIVIKLGSKHYAALDESPHIHVSLNTVRDERLNHDERLERNLALADELFGGAK